MMMMMMMMMMIMIMSLAVWDCGGHLEIKPHVVLASS
jgi:hypothetical protein